MNCFVMLCTIMLWCRQVNLKPFESIGQLHRENIERRGYIRGQTIVVREIVTII